MATNEGQAFCLRWNNHKSNLVEVLDALIQKECYVDCTIVVDGQVQFKAHRVVLAANSPYFQTILQDVPMDHCSILFPGVQPFEMRALLDYMYTGEVNVTQSQIPKIMKIAEQLEVKGLFDMTDLKEKFNKFDEPPTTSSHCYTSSGTIARVPTPTTPIFHQPPPGSGLSNLSGKDTDRSSGSIGSCGSISGEHQQQQQQQHQQSSSMITTSANVTPAHSSSSPPYTAYKSPYPNLHHSKSPGPSTSDSRHTQWSLAPHLPTSLLSSVYETGSDMNPLKRKKLHSISSMLMSKDTPILRNVLQPHPADSSQAVPPICQSIKQERPEKQGSGNCNGRNEFSSDKKPKYDEPHSPYTDKSYEDDGLDCPPNYPGDPSQMSGYSGQQQQKPEWKRYKQYTRSDILSAIECVRNGMSALQASRKFGVPSRTLYDKVKKLGITAGRPMNRTLKRSPSNGGNSGPNFSFGIGSSSHSYSGQNEPLLAQIHAENQSSGNDHRDKDHPHLPPTIPHPAAALLDPSFLQQALEGRGGDIAGREALHAMALVAAAHSAVNGMSTSPGANGSARSPSPNISMKYMRSRQSPPMHMKCDVDQTDDDEDRVEDLSIGRKEIQSPPPTSSLRSQSPSISLRSHSPSSQRRSSSIPSAGNHSYLSSSHRRSESPQRQSSPSPLSSQRHHQDSQQQQQQHHHQTGVIVPPISKLSSNGDEEYRNIEMKRECLTEDSRD